MKNLLILITIMLVGCATTPTMKSVAGTYEHKHEFGHTKLVFLENGVYERYRNVYRNGNVYRKREGKWSIVNKEIQVIDKDSEFVSVYKINKDKSIIITASMKDGKRGSISTWVALFTYKKIKATAKPVKKLPAEQKPRHGFEKALRDSVVGEYEIKLDGKTRASKWVFHKNGTMEIYGTTRFDKVWGKQDEVPWTIVNNEIHLQAATAYFEVFRINKDRSITMVATMHVGKRTDVLKEEQYTWKKIK